MGRLNCRPWHPVTSVTGQGLLADCRPPFVSPTSSFSLYALAVASLASTPGLTRLHPRCGWMMAVGRSGCTDRSDFPVVCRFRVCRPHVCRSYGCTYVCRSYIYRPCVCRFCVCRCCVYRSYACRSYVCRFYGYGPPTHPPPDCLGGGFVQGSSRSSGRVAIVCPVLLACDRVCDLPWRTLSCVPPQA